MKSGSDVAIDECIEGFEGRAKEAVNIPTPIGFEPLMATFLTGYGMPVAVTSEMVPKVLTGHGLMRV
jgi:hypothetical protein